MPVKSSDVMIGNWVFDIGLKKNIKISANDISQMVDYENSIYNFPYAAIPISSQILEASGFRYQNLAEVSPYETWEIKDIALWEYEKGDWIVEVGDVELDYKGWMLHDIQNLYYSLYKEELNIKIP